MSEAMITTDASTLDYPALVADLNRLLRLRATPIGMKMFKTREEMEAIPRIRRPKDIHTTDQIVGQACRNGWTVGITMDDLVGDQCGTVLGLHPRDEKWLSGDKMHGVWFGSLEDSAAHQNAMDVPDYGTHEAMVVRGCIRGMKSGFRGTRCTVYGSDLSKIPRLTRMQWMCLITARMKRWLSVL